MYALILRARKLAKKERGNYSSSVFSFRPSFEAFARGGKVLTKIIVVNVKTKTVRPCLIDSLASAMPLCLCFRSMRVFSYKY